jgi:hypothetical protein
MLVSKSFPYVIFRNACRGIGLRRVGKKQKQAPEAMLDQHIRSIGFSTREQYTNWCRALGFPIVMQKHRKQLARELAVANSLRQFDLLLFQKLFRVFGSLRKI